MEKYEFLSLYKAYNGYAGETDRSIGIHNESLEQWLLKPDGFAHAEGAHIVIDNVALAFEALSYMGFELKTTTLYKHDLSSTEYFCFQRKAE